MPPRETPFSADQRKSGIGIRTDGCRHQALHEAVPLGRVDRHGDAAALGRGQRAHRDRQVGVGVGAEDQRDAQPADLDERRVLAAEQPPRALRHALDRELGRPFGRLRDELDPPRVDLHADDAGRLERPCHDQLPRLVRRERERVRDRLAVRDVGDVEAVDLALGRLRNGRDQHALLGDGAVDARPQDGSAASRTSSAAPGRRRSPRPATGATRAARTARPSWRPGAPARRAASRGRSRRSRPSCRGPAGGRRGRRRRRGGDPTSSRRRTNAGRPLASPTSSSSITPTTRSSPYSTCWWCSR